MRASVIRNNLFNEGQYQKALETLNKIRKPDLPARLLKAWTTYRLQQIPEARKQFQGILDDLSAEKDSRKTINARVGLGYCALRQNDLKVAEQQFARVLGPLPDNSDALFGMGLVRYRQGKSQEAAKLLEKTIKLNPKNKEAREILARIKPKT